MQLTFKPKVTPMPAQYASKSGSVSVHVAIMIGTVIVLTGSLRAAWLLVAVDVVCGHVCLFRSLLILPRCCCSVFAQSEPLADRAGKWQERVREYALLLPHSCCCVLVSPACISRLQCLRPPRPGLYRAAARIAIPWRHAPGIAANVSSAQLIVFCAKQVQREGGGRPRKEGARRVHLPALRTLVSSVRMLIRLVLSCVPLRS